MTFAGWARRVNAAFAADLKPLDFFPGLLEKRPGFRINRGSIEEISLPIKGHVTARYNIFQILGAALCVLGGLVCFGLAYLFFLYLPALATSQFGFPLTRTTANLIAAASLLVLAFSGYRRWRSGGGLCGYHESALYHDLGEETAGACVVDYYVHRITGPAHAIGQLFLAGPLLLLRARTMVAGLLPNSPQLEERLATALEILRSANKWQSLEDYPSMRTEILYLAQMGKIDFSSHNGKCRMKASV